MKIILPVLMTAALLARESPMPAGEDLQQLPAIRIQIEDTPWPAIDESRFAARAPVTGTPLAEPDMVWVESSLASMTLAEKVGQMLMTSQNSDEESQIANYHLGGFIFIGNGQSAQGIVDRINALQGVSPFPLWFAIDSEAGVGARVSDATVFPLIMALGAADDPDLAEQLGRITARESQALGLQVAFGPCVDVNTEPLNPIISTRSASDQPGRVARVAQAFVHGARAEGVLTTFKHYPGHGATAGDSHSSLPGVDLPLDELKAVHMKPYYDLAASSDVDMVMTAHVWYSAVHPGTPWPATLSAIFNKDLLRDDIGFDGILISDAYTMAGLTAAVPDQGERAVVGVENGLDIILDTADMGAYHTALVNAVNSSRIPMSRIDESVRRILIAKSSAGLPARTTVDPSAWTSTLNAPEHRAVVRAIAEKGFTCGVNRIGTPAILPGDRVLILTLTSTTSIFYRYSSSYFTTPFTARMPAAVVRPVGTTVTTDEIDEIVGLASSYDKIIVAGYDWTRIGRSSHVTLVTRLAGTPTPVVYISFGAPYHFPQVAGVDAFYCGYASVPAMQEVAVEVLLGDRPALGRIPVGITGLPGGSEGGYRVY